MKLKLFSILVLFLAFCASENSIVAELQAQDTTQVYIDSTFTVNAVVHVTGKVSGIGCHIHYDSTQVQVDSIYNLPDIFKDELVVLKDEKQGELVIGFWQDCEDAISDTTVTLFSLDLHVRLTAGEGISKIYITDKQADLCDEAIEFKHKDLDFLIKKLNEILMEFIIE